MHSLSTIAGRLIGFARELQGATTFAEVLLASQAELTATVGYTHAWLFIEDAEDPSVFRLIDMAGAKRALAWADYATLPIEGDAMIADILRADAPVVVDDARTDPRTNKQIVEQVGNRTIINIPLRLVDRPLGIFGTGTFGDEGCRPPTREQVDYLVAMSGQITVAASRIRIMEERAVAAKLRMELEQRLQHMQRLDSLGLLAAGVAHDFNNLLTIMLARASLLRSAMPDTSRSDLAAIVEAAERGAKLTRQLLAMGRAQHLTRAPTDMNRLLRSLLDLLGRVFPQTVELDLVKGVSLPPVSGDESQLHQVFMNLCLNARDAMPEGGRLTVETEQVVINGSYVAAHPWAKAGRYVLVSVTDTGTGMSKEVAERVFEPFFTTKDATNVAGSGLGLAVAYGIVRQHEGLIHCYSELGVGTSFKVYLPVLERSASDVGTKLEGPVPGGVERILVAEDDPALRETIQRALEKGGYHVSVVAEGEAACQAASTSSYDVVLLDVSMPELGGVAALERIATLLPDARFILSSGHGGDGAAGNLAAGKSATSGVRYHWLQKPYATDTLLRFVRQALDDSRQ